MYTTGMSHTVYMAHTMIVCIYYGCWHSISTVLSPTLHRIPSLTNFRYSICILDKKVSVMGRCPIQVYLLSWGHFSQKINLAPLGSSWHTKMIYPDWRLMHSKTWKPCLRQTMCPKRWYPDWSQMHKQTCYSCLWQTMCSKRRYPDWSPLSKETWIAWLWQTMCPKRWYPDWSQMHKQTWIAWLWQTMCPNCWYSGWRLMPH